MRPADFVRFLHGIAARAGFAGGAAPGSAAITSVPMPGGRARRSRDGQGRRAGARVRDGRASARFTSTARWPAAAIPTPLPEELVAARAATLAAAAEQAWRAAGGEAPVYVIGTEVPTPGGATEDLGTARGHDAAGGRGDDRRASRGIRPQRASRPHGRACIALVVQPGSSSTITRSSTTARARRGRSASSSAGSRSSSSRRTPPTTSPRTASRSLVRDHFAILKVGPGATFALRETLWGLAAIEQALPGSEPRA